MVVKRDFDKVLVNLLRTSDYLPSIALIDAEGMPISFASKSRKYQIKPATLGSKTKILLFLAKNFAKANGINPPIIQIFFFKRLALIIVNLKVVSFFILMDLKGWPPDGKILYQNFVKIKKLLIDIEKSQDDALKSLIEGDKAEQFEISDVSDNFIKVIAKNMNSLNQIEIISRSIDKKGLNLVKSDESSLNKYLKQNLTNNKFLRVVCVNEKGKEIYKSKGCNPEFSTEIPTIIKNSIEELRSFDLGDLLWILNIYEKSELSIITKLGRYPSGEVYEGILLENRVGNLKDALNQIYNVLSEINAIQNDSYLDDLIESLEFIGLPVSDLNIKIEKTLIKGNQEEALSLLERAAKKLENNGTFSEAGSYYGRMGELLGNSGEFNKAAELYKKAAEMHMQEKNYERAGDEFYNLGKFAVRANNISEGIKNYKDALSHYKKSGKKKKIATINSEIANANNLISDQLKEFIQSSTGESIPFSFLQDKYDLTEDLLINTFKSLFDNNLLSGQINLIKKRYTKKKYGSNESIVGEERTTDNYELPEIKFEALSKNLEILNRDLENTEEIFERINFPFDKYLNYENSIHKLNYFEQKQKIYKNNLESNKCIICFKVLEKNDKVFDCGNGHYFHINCAKVWLENQRTCPICEIDLLENLKTMHFENIGAKDDLLSLQEITNSLKTKLNNLEEQLKKREEQIFLMKEYSKKDKSIFEKLLVERDSKALLEKDLKKKEKLIEELRSLLEIIKR